MSVSAWKYHSRREGKATEAYNRVKKQNSPVSQKCPEQEQEAIFLQVQCLNGFDGVWTAAGADSEEGVEIESESSFLSVHHLTGNFCFLSSMS